MYDQETLPYGLPSVTSIAMRTHGWGGSPPDSDEAARERILEATRRCLESPSVSIASIADELKVTRQTIYRYFPSTSSLLQEAAGVHARPFIDRLAEELTTLRLDAPELLAECIVVTLEAINDDPWLRRVYGPGKASAFRDGVTSPHAAALGRSVLDRLQVDWAAEGFDDAELGELVEQTFRMLQSLLADPGTPPRTADEHRSYLRRWFAPAVSALRAPRRDLKAGARGLRIARC